MSQEARDLADKFGGIWEQHPDYPLIDWQNEVADNNTRSSYWDWVSVEIEVSANRGD